MHVFSSIGLPPTTAVLISVLVFLGYIIFSGKRKKERKREKRGRVRTLVNCFGKILHLDTTRRAPPLELRTSPIWWTATFERRF